MNSKALVLATVLIAMPLVASAQDTPGGTGPSEPQAAASPAQKVEPPGILPQPSFITRAVDFTAKFTREPGRPSNGFYVDFSNMLTGAGWVSAGPGYRHWLFGDRAIVDGSAALSWHAYKMAQGRFELPSLANDRLGIGSQVMWQDATQVSYYGVGPQSLEENRTEYRLKYTDVVGYATVRPVPWLAIGGRLGWMRSPTVQEPGGTFKTDNPYTATLFPGDPVFAVSQQPSYIHGDVSITTDTRDSRSHPSSGSLYRAMLASYSDRDTGAFSFRRYEAEALHFLPFAEKRIVLALHGWFVGSDTTDGRNVPFYLAPSVGGGTSLRAFDNFRFHDRNALSVNVESRFAVITHLDVSAFVDAGNVAPRPGALSLGKRAYGVGLRMHTANTTFARLDVAHGSEGWRFLVRTTDPLHLSRLSRRTAAAPFAP